MEEGTRKRKLMTFSTMPTAAASFKPLRFAMIVMMMKCHLDQPILQSDGNPDLKKLEHDCLLLEA